MNNYVFCCSSRISFKLTSYFKLITKTILGASSVKVKKAAELLWKLQSTLQRPLLLTIYRPFVRPWLWWLYPWLGV